MELKNLHNEWFPINYTQEFFDRIKKKNVIALGCFYRLVIGDSVDDKPEQHQEILIGTIMSKIQEEGENNQAVFDKIDIDEPRLANTFWNQLRNLFSC